MEKGYRILLAEDEPKLSSVIQEELNNCGYNIRLFYSTLIYPIKTGCLYAKNFVLPIKTFP